MKLKSINIKNKKGLEMAFSTIVVLVLAVSLLVLGLVFIKKVMCSGIVLTDQVDTAVQSQLASLFEQGEYGVKCMGEAGTTPVKLGSGGQRQIICTIYSDSGGTYEINSLSIAPIGTKGASSSVVTSWLIQSTGFSGNVNPGKKTTVRIGILDLPSDVPATTVELKYKVKGPNDSSAEDRSSIISIVPAGFVTSTLC